MIERRWIHFLLCPALLLAVGAMNLSCKLDLGRDRPDSAAMDHTLTDLAGPDGQAADAPREAATPDIKLADLRLDLGRDMKQPDKLVYKDGPMPDQSLDLGAVLAKGTFSTGGPGSGGNMLLVEGGFEVGQQLCASTKNICVVGGITP